MENMHCLAALHYRDKQLRLIYLQTNLSYEGEFDVLRSRLFLNNQQSTSLHLQKIKSPVVAFCVLCPHMVLASKTGLGSWQHEFLVAPRVAAR